MRTAWFVAARVRGGTAMVASAATFVLLYAVIPIDAIPVPGRGGVQGLLWPILPIAWTVPLFSFGQLWDRSVERVGLRRLWIGAAVIIATSSAAGIISATFATQLDANVLTRNLFFFLGIAGASIAVLPPQIRWLPLLATTGGMWLIGTDGVGQAKPWAILFLPGGVPAATTIAAWTWAAGSTVFVLRSATADNAINSRTALWGAVVGLVRRRAEPSDQQAYSSVPARGEVRLVQTAAVLAVLGALGWLVTQRLQSVDHLDYERSELWSSDISNGRVTFHSVSQSSDREISAILVPASVEQVGCILAVHGLGGTASDMQPIADQMAERGWTTIAPSEPWGGNFAEGIQEAQLRGRSPSEQLRNAMVDLRRSLDWLEQNGTCRGRIGYLGISMGAMVGVPVVAYDDRIDVAALVLPGATYSATLAQTAPNVEIDLSKWDPVRHAPGIDRRPILLVNARNDDIVPSKDASELHAALPNARRIWVDGGHEIEGEALVTVASEVDDLFGQLP